MDRELLPSWFQDTMIFDVSAGNALIALVAAMAIYFVMQLGLRFTMNRLSAFAGQTSTRADDVLVEVLGNTNRFLLALVAMLVGIGLLDLPDRWSNRVGQLWFIALALQVALWMHKTIDIGLRRYGERHALDGAASKVSAAATLMSWGLRILLWAVVLLAMLSNLGVNITAFIASLGVGGIAVALAAQNILGDLFASMAIAIDKPFEVGDFIVLASIAGTVENVGVKTTRIRSLGGEQIVMSNTELLKQTVSNYKRLQARRIVFGFGVTYSTTPEQAEAIPRIVKKTVEGSDKLRFDRAHFKAFGESSLDYEVVYIVLDAEYNIYMDEQQRINLELLQAFAREGIEFAFPTRTIYTGYDPRVEAQKLRSGRYRAPQGAAQGA